MMQYQCPCCQFWTIFDDAPPGTYQICPVCGWEDDNVQFHDPAFRGGANEMSLNEAKRNYKLFGAISTEATKYTRPPNKAEISPVKAAKGQYHKNY